MSWWDAFTNKPRGVFGRALPDQPQPGGCDHRSIHLRQGTAEFEWFVARGELETTKNLAHGANHLANLLSYDPSRRDWLELLDRYLAAAQPDPETLIPRGEQLYYTTEAMRAYIWHKQGRFPEALDLLCEVTKVKPTVRYLEAWALDWLEPAGAVEMLPWNLGLLFFSLGLNRHNEATKSTPARVAAVQRYAALLDRFASQYPNDGMSTMLQVGLHRKAGNFDRAYEIAQAAMKSNPNWHTATALGLVLRYRGEPDKAEKAFMTALELDPQDVSARLEAGDTFFEVARYDKALKWYESALAAERGQPWARASALYCRWKLTDDPKHLRELIQLAQAEPSNQRASHLWDLAYGAGLPEPGDATTNLLHQFREQILSDRAKAPTGAARMALTSLEAPSNYVAFRLEMEALHHDLTLKVVSSHVPTPDPRQPIAPVKYLLWKYDDINARPGLPPPEAEVATAIAQIARQLFDYDSWWAAAARTAQQLGARRVEDILAVLVHPPALPPDMSALAWLPRVHFAACAVLAHLDSGWEESVRRAALLSVLHGPMDWTTEAAVRVLAYLGQDEEPLAPDIHDEFQRLYDQRPSHGHWGWYRTLLQCWQWLPHLYDAERDEMRKQLAALDEESTEEETQE
jgi:tetratricopeptide (TPR) repeat protein